MYKNNYNNKYSNSYNKHQGGNNFNRWQTTQQKKKKYIRKD